MPVETRSEWLQKHGPSIRLEDRTLVFADGASAVDGPGYFWQYEPPDDPRKRWETIAKYHAELLRRIDAMFRHVKAVATGRETFLNWDERPPLGPMPPVSDAFALLDWLKAKAVPVKARIAECEAAIEALPEVQRERAREKSFQESVRRREAAAAEERQRIAAMSL